MYNEKETKRLIVKYEINKKNNSFSRDASLCYEIF